MPATSDGLELHFERIGDGAPVLFIHGFPLAGSMWHAAARRLPPGWQALLPDLRGHGRSGVSPEVGIARFAADLAELLDALGERRPAVVCGLSMGGVIALEFYRRCPDRVRGLVLCDTRANAETPEGVARRESIAQTALRAGSDAVARMLLDNCFAPEAPAELKARWLAVMSATPPVGVAAAARALAGRADSIPTLPAISVPTLVVCGDQDALTPPEMMRAMHALIPGSRFALIAGAGHLPPVEQPEAFAAALGEFLRGLG